MQPTALQDALALVHSFRQSGKFTAISTPLKDHPNVVPVGDWITQQNIMNFLSAEVLSKFDEVLYAEKYYVNQFRHVMSLFYASLYRDAYDHSELVNQLAFSVSLNTPLAEDDARIWPAIYDSLIPDYEDAVVLLKANKHLVFAILIAIEFGLGD
jgi:hypothetical protein